MEVSVEIPTDPDGFISRECPTCEGRFKWFVGETPDTPDDWETPDQYFCPRCGVSSDHDDFWTPEQLEYATEIALQQFSPEVDAMFESAFKGASSKNMQLKRTGRIELGSNPPAPEDTDDMAAIASPCHAFEPIKMPHDWDAPIHCLICGDPFEL